MFHFQTHDVSINSDTIVESSFIAANNSKLYHHFKNSYLLQHTFGVMPKLVIGFHFDAPSRVCKRHTTVCFSNKCQPFTAASTRVLFSAWLLRSAQVPKMETTCRQSHLWRAQQLLSVLGLFWFSSWKVLMDLLYLYSCSIWMGETLNIFYERTCMNLWWDMGLAHKGEVEMLPLVSSFHNSPTEAPWLRFS